MNWFENKFGFRIPPLFSFKNYRDGCTNNLPDVNSELEVYDDIKEDDNLGPVQSLFSDQSNPRNSMLKNSDENKCRIYEEDDVIPNNQLDFDIFSGNQFPNHFFDGIGLMHRAMSEIFNGFGGFQDFDIQQHHWGDHSSSTLFDSDDNRKSLRKRDGQSDGSLYQSPNMKMNFKSTSISRTVQADGTIVEKKIYKDSSGAEEETITTYER